MPQKIAFYPGSFDPFTNGHLDILLQGFAIADRIVIGIGVHSGKKGLFSFDERKALIEAALPETLRGQVSVVSFDDLVVDAARRNNAPILLRGLRDGSDLDYEMQMAGMNGAMAGNVQTVFFAGQPGNAAHHRHIGTPDSLDGRRCVVLRPGTGRCGA